MAKDESNFKVVADNRRARYNYEIGDVFEAGLVLTGTEVKSLRSGKATIAESYASAEIAKLTQGVAREGMTLIPLKVYFNDRGRAKLTLAIGRGKKLHDKRATEKERDWNREKSRVLRDKG